MLNVRDELPWHGCSRPGPREIEYVLVEEVCCRGSYFPIVVSDVVEVAGKKTR